MNKLPKARTEHLVEQNLGAETLIYDLTTHRAFNLNETSTIVYRACDGTTSLDELKRKHKFTDDFIFLALDELKRNNLLAEPFNSPVSQTNRREVIRRVGLATMFALPIITGLVAPTAANAASGQQGPPTPPTLGTACSSSADCRSGFCASIHNGAACCYNSGPNVYLSGQTDTFSGPIFLFPRGPAPADSDKCPDAMRCCDGRSSYGSCSYIFYGESEISEETLYTSECTCTCP